MSAAYNIIYMDNSPASYIWSYILLYYRLTEIKNMYWHIYIIADDLENFVKFVTLYIQ